MKNILSYLLLSLAVFTTVSTSFFSCRPAKSPKAEVKIVDSLDKAVEGVEVRLICTEIKCIIGDTQMTNSAGVTTHEFKQLEVCEDGCGYVLKILAFKDVIMNVYDEQLDTMVLDTVVFEGDGYLELLPDETAKETVVISPKRN